MREDVAAWFERRTTTASDWPVDLLATVKGPTTVSVVLPALNEEPTVGRIVEIVHRSFGTAAPEHRRLVDELVVIDGGSTDRTAEIAAAAGARVVQRAEILPEHTGSGGKGEAMWRSLAVTTGDIVVFVDADLQSFTPSYITGLLGPLLTDDSVHLVKAVYERPLVEGATVVPAGGGRVTELVARPLLSLLYPELTDLVQPLSGEYGGYRHALEAVPFLVGYGVEIGLLIDLSRRFGVDALAQVDLGVRRHRNRPLSQLGPQAMTIMQVALRRHVADLVPEASALIRPDADPLLVSAAEMPALIDLPDYLERHPASRA